MGIFFDALKRSLVFAFTYPPFFLRTGRPRFFLRQCSKPYPGEGSEDGFPPPPPAMWIRLSRGVLQMKAESRLSPGEESTFRSPGGKTDAHFLFRPGGQLCFFRL